MHLARPGNKGPKEGGRFPWEFLLISDMEKGFFILDPIYLRACYLEGKVTDGISGAPLGNVEIEILDTDVLDYSQTTGDYAIGIAVKIFVYITNASKSYIVGIKLPFIATGTNNANLLFATMPNIKARTCRYFCIRIPASCFCRSSRFLSKNSITSPVCRSIKWSW